MKKVVLLFFFLFSGITSLMAQFSLTELIALNDRFVKNFNSDRSAYEHITNDLRNKGFVIKELIWVHVLSGPDKKTDDLKFSDLNDDKIAEQLSVNVTNKVPTSNGAFVVTLSVITDNLDQYNLWIKDLNSSARYKTRKEPFENNYTTDFAGGSRYIITTKLGYKVSGVPDVFEGQKFERVTNTYEIVVMRETK